MKLYMKMLSLSLLLLSADQAFAMRLSPKETLRPITVSISNHTNESILVYTDASENNIESFDDYQLKISPDYAITSDKAHPTTIFTQQGCFKLDYNGNMNRLFLNGEEKEIGSLGHPKSPIVIFGENEVTLKERE